MNEKPIVFNSPMALAVHERRKTQTRRLLKNPEHYGCPTGDCPHWAQVACDQAMAELYPKGKVGDRLWVREAFQRTPSGLIYKAGHDVNSSQKWLSPYDMTRAESRYLLTITEIRFQQLLDISIADCLAEGMALNNEGTLFGSQSNENLRLDFFHLWDSIAGVGAHKENPWLWALTFEVVNA